MLKNAILLAVSSIAIAGFAPSFLPLLAPAPREAAKAPAAEAAPEPSATPTPQQVSSDREISLRADARGQYFADTLLNGQQVRMLVDTGASYVTLSAGVADRLGLHPLLGAPHGRVQTANGIVEVTPVELSTIAIGPIFMTRVRGYVLPSEAGNVNLIGANFLKQLVGVEQRGGLLYLRQ